eukprot:RCo020190
MLFRTSSPAVFLVLGLLCELRPDVPLGCRPTGGSVPHSPVALCSRRRFGMLKLRGLVSRVGQAFLINHELTLCIHMIWVLCLFCCGVSAVEEVLVRPPQTWLGPATRREVAVCVAGPALRVSSERLANLRRYLLEPID